MRGLGSAVVWLEKVDEVWEVCARAAALEGRGDCGKARGLERWEERAC